MMTISSDAMAQIHSDRTTRLARHRGAALSFRLPRLRSRDAALAPAPVAVLCCGC